ncbi:MAG: hypothetical protein EPN37_10425 [Chitinophagaceae bacterium]|jgi:hypothetical protein|nr:MAG: hypothetical protein EPN37_10425 [Chitinophagaceae bacterium]
MKYVILIVGIFLISCSKNNYIIGGKKNPTNKVNETTYQFLESFPVTTETAQLIKRAGLTDEVNGDVTIIAPSNYAVDRFLRRKNNRRLRLNPDTSLLTVSTIPVDTLQQLKMYIVDGKWWSKTIPKGGIVLPTHEPGDTILLYADSTSDSEPGAAWDGSGIPGLGYQYLNFMQTKPVKVYVHFKRGQYWEMTPQERLSMGYDNPECDQVYEMYISDVVTTTGVVHVIYSGDYDFSDHYYYHTLFFFGTRADDLL